MSIRTPVQDEMAIFCAVAEAGGFSAAARRLRVTKSAVSKAVQKLEAQLSARLLHRTTRRISLTEAGEAFYQHARLAVQQAEAAADAVASLAREPQGTLRVTAPMSLGLARLADIVAEFLLRYPRIRIDLHLDDGRVDLVAGGFDLAIRAGTLEDSSMVAREIARMPAVLVASPGYIDKHGQPRELEDLHAHACLLYSFSRSVGDWQFIRQGVVKNIRVDGRYEVNSSIALRKAVIAGAGISRIPVYLVQEDLVAGRLVQLLPEYTMDSATIYAVFPERGFIPAKARLFAEFVQASLRE